MVKILTSDNKSNTNDLHSNLILIVKVFRHLPMLVVFTSQNHNSGIMVSVFASSAVDRSFESRSCQTKDYKIGICCFSARSIKEKE